MSEYDPHPDRRRHTEEEARVAAAKWSPWVWVIPVLAIFFVGWLVVRYGFFGGGDITVRFTDARGLDRYSPVRFRGAKVGTVQKITIDEKLQQVVVRISMDASMNGSLRKGTRFWIVEPGLEGGVGSILSGTYVGIEPGPGEEASEFVGQEYAPVVAPPEAGKTVVLQANAGTVPVGSPVQYRGMKVGRILGSEYDPASGTTNVYAFVVKRYASQIRQSTRFWRGGGLNVSLSGGGLSMGGGGGIASLLSSPIQFYTPETLAGAEVPNGTHFDLYESEAVAIASADGPHLTYLTYFPGPLKGLKAGTPVQMKGVQVGRVRDVRLRYVRERGALETPVTLEIDPRLLEITGSTREELRASLNDALATLVQKGMRASLGGSIVLPGASAVSLDLVARPGTARLNTSVDPPIIPAAPGGSGLEGALGAVGDLATTIRNLPIQEIAGDLRSAAKRINTLVQDPVLDSSLRRLDASLTNIEKAASITRENVGPLAQSLRSAAASAENAAKTVEGTAKTIDRTANDVSQNVGPIVESLRNAAGSAESAARRAEQLMGTSARQNYDLGELIKELTRAAEAVRALATYLEENPDSLIKGRGK